MGLIGVAPPISRSLPPELEERLIALERSLLDPARRANINYLDTILSDDFFEIGQSGATYDKAGVASALVESPGFDGSRTPDEFFLQQIAPDVVLMTYRIVETGTRRSSLWRCEDTQWRMIFSQGTRPSD